MSNTTRSDSRTSAVFQRARRDAVPAPSLLIEGSVSPGFEPVRQAFGENFTRRGELGAACCIYQDGEKVVDLWGGLRDSATGERWHADTMTIVHSTTKGLAAMVMALAHSRGTNRMGTNLQGDPRDVALREAIPTRPAGKPRGI